MTVVARESLDERGGISTPRKREGGQIQSGSPPLGALAQAVRLRVGQVQPEDIVEQTIRLHGAGNANPRFAPRQGRRWPCSRANGSKGSERVANTR